MGARDLKIMQKISNLPAVNCGKSSAPALTDAQRKIYEDADKAVQKAEDAWVAAGRPWTDDDEAFLRRMTGF